MKKAILHLSMFLAAGMLLSQAAYAQGIGINSTGANPHSSAGLDVDFNNKGLLPPRMTTTQRNAIGTPTAGLTIFNTTSGCVNIYNGNNWRELCPTVISATIASLDCAGATNNGTLTSGVAASSVNSVVSYTGGDGEAHSGQTVSSTGVTGLTATLSAGTFASGSGTLTYTITGTPSAAGTASFALNIGGQSCTLTRTVAVGSIGTLDCAGATNNGTLTSGVAATGVNSVVSYTGGNGGTHSGQTVSSTGVTGLTATLSAGTFASGNGSLTYDITGTPSAGGTASFAFNIGGQSCTLTRTVVESFTCGTSTVTFTYRGSSVTYGTVVGANARCWLDRNLGASQVAINSTHFQAYGDQFQWGRGDDGHQAMNWTASSYFTNNTEAGVYVNTPVNGPSGSATPGNAFLLVNGGNWYNGTNPDPLLLWQGVNGINNPCPNGWRIPTQSEWETERLSWNPSNAAGAYASPLKLTMAGGRTASNGLGGTGTGQMGFYWSGTASGSTSAHDLFFNGSSTAIYTNGRGDGHSVRCIKD